MSVSSIEPAIIRLIDGTHILIHRTADVYSGTSNTTPVMVLQNDEQISETQDGDNWAGTALFPEGSEKESGTGSLEQNTCSLENEAVNVLGKVVISYKCNFCPFLAEERDELLKHFSWNHGEGRSSLPPAKIQKDLIDPEDRQQPPDIPEPSTKEVYQCGECEGVFPTFEDCKQHMFDNHNLVVAETEITNSTASSTRKGSGKRPEKTKSAKITQSTESRYKCTLRGCQFIKFSNKESLDYHSRCHETESKEFRCFECSKTFDRWRTCALHLWKSHELDAGLLSCPICLVYKTITSVKLENHLKVHGEDRPYICSEFNCGKSFKQASQLRNHRVLHIDRTTGKVPRWYSTQKCDICDKNFADSKCLKKHIQAVHSKMRPYVCNVCGHASARKAMLQMHSRQHTGEKPYCCEACPYRTGDHNSLRRHRMRHTGDRPYRCPHCPYASIQSNSYKNHLRSKHPGGQGAFGCEECDFRTVSAEAHIAHCRDHARERLEVASSSKVEIFPENEMAAELVYNCFGNIYSGGTWKTNLTGSTTSADGTTQTITIHLPTGGGDDIDTRRFYQAKLEDEEEDEEDDDDHPIDTGGITIPADPDPPY